MTRDAYYKKRRRGGRKNGESAVVLKLVDQIRDDEPRVGTRKLQDRLQKSGMKVGRDRLFSILRNSMRLVKPKKCYKKTTYSRHSYAVAPNLVTGTKVEAVGQVLVSDCTYLRLTGRRFAYLFLVTDAYSRRIVGHCLTLDLSHYSALIALDNAVRNLRDTIGVIHHSDRGCQYCCHEYLNFLSQHDMKASMTSESHCYQNAIAERVNGILKDEFNLDTIFATFSQLAGAVKNAINVYNTKRTHWSLGLQTPMEVFLKAA